MSSDLSIPSLDEVRAAQSRIHGIAIRTPLLKFNYEIPGLELYLKCEQFQPISSFKIRGATNAFKVLSEKEKENGVVTASSGNMGQGVAWIAKQENIKCRVLVHDTSNPVKLKAIEELGGEVTRCPFDQWWEAIVSHQCPLLKGHFIHPVCNRHVMAGNGTIALEILDELPECDAIIVPYDGGALSTGIASIAKQLKPSIDVFASEIDTAAPLAAAFQADQVTEIPLRKSWVDGVVASSVVEEMWPLVKHWVDGSITVTLQQTAEALKLLIERNHLICEGASVTTVAAGLYHYMNHVQNGQAGLRRNGAKKPIKVVAILSGAGIDYEAIIKCLQGTL